MATVNWPTARAFAPTALKIGASTPKAAWSAMFTGQTQSISHLADRLMCTISLPPCTREEAGQREAFFMSLASTGDWVSLGMKNRPVPYGTLRGTPTAQASAAAGARTLSVQTTAGATMIGGDALGINGQLLLTAYAGATANGSGVMSLPLVLPLRAAVSSSAALTWNAPVATWQLAADSIDFSYQSYSLQDAMQIVLREVY
jgi:hypothetical protein